MEVIAECWVNHHNIVDEISAKCFKVGNRYYFTVNIIHGGYDDDDTHENVIDHQEQNWVAMREWLQARFLFAPYGTTGRGEWTSAIEPFRSALDESDPDVIAFAEKLATHFKL